MNKPPDMGGIGRLAGGQVPNFSLYLCETQPGL